MPPLKYIFLTLGCFMFANALLAQDIPQQNENDMGDLCSGHSQKLYCTCSPGEYDIHYAECILMQLVKPSDIVWELITSNHKLKRIRLISHVGVAVLTYFPVRIMGPNNIVESVTIQHSAITAIPQNAFRNSSHLSEIDLSQNKIEILHPSAFAHLPELEDLILSSNDLTTIKDRTFIDLPRLRFLTLNLNNLQLIEDGVFNGLSNLQELDLSSNSLKELKPGTFRGLSRLSRLDLGYNKIKHLGAEAFIGLSSIDAIDLRENEIETIDSKAFHGVSNLMKLYLVKNKIVQLSNGIFGSLKRLMYLDLRHNNLETLTEQTMAPLIKDDNITRVYWLVTGNKFICDCRIQWILKMMNVESHGKNIEWGNVTCTPPQSKSLPEEFDVQADEMPDNFNHPIVISDAAAIMYLEICPKEHFHTEENFYTSSESPSADIFSFPQNSHQHNLASSVKLLSIHTYLYAFICFLAVNL